MKNSHSLYYLNGMFSPIEIIGEMEMWFKENFDIIHTVWNYQLKDN